MLQLPAATSLILASASPRRLELLGRLGLPFMRLHPDFEELWQEGEAAEAYAQRNAEGKARWPLRHAADALPAEAQRYLLLGADTIVVLDGEILEKPTSLAHAQVMLAKLSGRMHTVYTGLCLLEAGPDRREKRVRSAVCSSRVRFKALTASEITAYVATGEPMDKAGAYAVQGLGSYMVSRIEGSYTNVMGLPLTETYEWLANWLVPSP